VLKLFSKQQAHPDTSPTRLSSQQLHLATLRDLQNLLAQCWSLSFSPQSRFKLDQAQLRVYSLIRSFHPDSYQVADLQCHQALESRLRQQQHLSER
jgi:hypothetical protein